MGSAEAIEKVADGLTMLADIDVDALPDAAVDELLIGLRRLTHRLAAEDAQAADCWAQRNVWTSDGSRSPAARLARDGHCSVGAARATLQLGKAMAAMPHVAAAFAAGDLSADHVDVLAAARPGREELFARDEELLVGQATTLRFGQFHKAQTYWRNRADADLDRDGTEPVTTPSLTLTPVGDLVSIDGQLDPIGGAVVTKALDAIADELAPQHPDKSRAELRAIALVEMARRAMATTGPPARILLQIICGADEFTKLCELSNGTVVRPGQIVPYLDAIDIRTLIFDTPIRAIGASSQRTFTGALRRAIQARDRHCHTPPAATSPSTAATSTTSPRWAHTHDTTQDNGRLLRIFHNRIQPQFARPPTPVADDPNDEDDDNVIPFRIIRITYDELRRHGP